MKKQILFWGVLIAGVVFLPIVIAAVAQNNDDSKTYVNVKNATNSIYIAADASCAFTCYHWEDDGKTLIITYEEGDHD